MKNIRRRFVTLIEVLIAMGLLTLLIGALFSLYGDLLYSEVTLDKKKEEAFRWRYLEARLSKVITCAIMPKEEEKTLFYTDSPIFAHGHSLVFYYDNETDLDPHFSCSVLGRIFLDREGRLLLCTWPDPERYPDLKPPPLHLEVLFEGVTDLHWAFYIPHPKDTPIEVEQIGEENLTPTGGWHYDGWKRGYHKVPPLVQVHLKLQNEKEITFVYHLPHNHYPLEMR